MMGSMTEDRLESVCVCVCIFCLPWTFENVFVPQDPPSWRWTQTFPLEKEVLFHLQAQGVLFYSSAHFPPSLLVIGKLSPSSQ